MSITEVFFYIIYLLMTVALVLGFIICKKKAFVEGMVFFGIMFFLQIYTLFVPYYIGRIIDSRTRYNIPGNMTIGEFVSLLSLLNPFINAIGFVILVVGLRKIWVRERDQ